MVKYRIIGNMTGNSMDAIDLVITEFDDDIMTDICTYTKPYSRDMQERIASLREQSFNKTKAEIEQLPDFVSVHNDYISQIAECINEMCYRNNIAKNSIDAIGFHGKTLDHNPPSKASADNTQPYTLQIGSGQMLADMTNIPVVYDFRSDAVMAGFDGAPLVPPHNAHISKTEGDGIYYNGGNTSNFAVVVDGRAQVGSDAGPFNEYIDAFIRRHTDNAFDKDGVFGYQGTLDKEMLQVLFNLGRPYYEALLPKSGDPAYYHQNKVFDYIKSRDLRFEDAVHTLEYFAAYIAAQALTLIPDNIDIPAQIILFGGGWKNPIVQKSFSDLLRGEGEYILPEHQEQFANLQIRLGASPNIRYSNFGEYMEARLFADLARYRLENKGWEIPEIIASGQSVVCGIIAYPKEGTNIYTDLINRAAKGWQNP